jgi:two-component system, sensor histidine kinase YesM
MRSPIVGKRIFPFAVLFLFVIILSLVFLIFFPNSFSTLFFVGVFTSTLFLFLIWFFIPIYRLEKSIDKYMNNDISYEGFCQGANLSHLSDALIKFQEDFNKGFETSILNQQAEINYLHQQINPHFLYNSLESIRGNAIIKGEDGIAEMTEALATFFRYSISQKGSIVTLEEEIENVRNYFIIQQYRFNNKYSIDYIFDEENGILTKYFIPKLTMQPIVENAIYHGLEKKVDKGKVTIRITRTDQRLIINIIDDGIGIPEARLESLNDMLSSDRDIETVGGNPGIALYNVNKRIKLYFGEKYGLFIFSTVNIGTDVEIVLPLITNKDIRHIED